MTKVNDPTKYFREVCRMGILFVNERVFMFRYAKKWVKNV